MQARGPQVPQEAKQGPEARDPKWSWVEASIWNERMLAALDNGVKGSKWFSLIDKVYRATTLQAAWQRVRANKGAAGVDGQSVEMFDRHAERYLEELRDQLERGQYCAQPVRRVEIPKGVNQTRPLGIPVVKDRIVQTAVKMVIEPIFEAVFMPQSYGFRPGRSAHDALREVDRLLKAGFTHVVDADLQGYFDSIPHAGLRERVSEKISDGRVLKLIDDWLGQEIVSEAGRWTPSGGTPQGAVLSPLLANCYLHPLDVRLVACGWHIVRYADDFVVLCATAEQAQGALTEIQRWVEAHGLQLHPAKTHVGDCLQEGQGFEFLGYRFEAGRRRVRQKSVAKFRERIREKTSRRRGESLRAVIASLNPILRGWFNYFKHAYHQTFAKVDGFVRRRLRTLLRYQSKRRGHGHTHADHRRWPNAFFAEQGLFTLHAAHALASQSR